MPSGLEKAYEEASEGRADIVVYDIFKVLYRCTMNFGKLMEQFPLHSVHTTEIVCLLFLVLQQVDSA